MGEEIIFSHNVYLEEADKFSKPGSVTQMRAHFEAHFKKNGTPFLSSVEAQTWGEIVHHHHHHQAATEKDENFWESLTQCTHYSYEQYECDQEKSQFRDSCVSYDDNLVNSNDDHSSLSVALEKTEIGYSERTLEDKVETTSSSATTWKPLKNNQKAITNYAETTKTSTKKHVVIPKGSSSCNDKTSIDTKRSKYCIESAMREKKSATNGFSFRTNEQAQKNKEENVEAVARKALNFKARPMPKRTQARPQHTSTGQAKGRNDAQEHSSKVSCDRSLTNGTAKSKLTNTNQKTDTQRILNGIRPSSSDANRRSLAVRRSAVEVAL